MTRVSLASLCSLSSHLLSPLPPWHTTSSTRRGRFGASSVRRCSVTVTDYVREFAVTGGSGNGHLQSRIYQGQAGTVGAGKWVYEYRIDLAQVAGITYIPYADELAIYNWGTLRQYDLQFRRHRYR